MVYVKFQVSHTNAETDWNLSRVVLTCIVMTSVHLLVPRVSTDIEVSSTDRLVVSIASAFLVRA